MWKVETLAGRVKSPVPFSEVSQKKVLQQSLWENTNLQVALIIQKENRYNTDLFSVYDALSALNTHTYTLTTMLK